MVEFALGIDIGGTFTKIGVVDENGKVHASSKISTSSYAEVSQFIDALFRESLKLLHQVQLSFEEIKGIGVGVPNGNTLDGSIHFAPNLPWKGKIFLAAELEKKMNTKVLLTNDANAAAIAEKVYGDARQSNDFAVITVGTGLGSGIVSQGKLLLGATGMAGELGHTTLIPEGRTCTCGNKGCVEAYVSVRGFVETYKDLVLTADTIAPEEIVQKALHGDQLAIEAVKFTGRYLGIALANLTNILSLDLVLLTGGLMTQGTLFLPYIQQSFSQHVLPVLGEQVTIRLSRFSAGETGLLGAAALVFFPSWAN